MARLGRGASIILAVLDLNDVDMTLKFAETYQQFFPRFP
jgi:hypothetical protein